MHARRVVRGLLTDASMKRPTCLTLVLLAVLLARSAAAQPGLEEPPPPPPPSAAPPAPVDRAYVSGGLLVTVDHFLNAAWMLDGGVRLGELPIAIHASGAKGGALDADNGGEFWRVMAGVELRSSAAARPRGYAFLDLDLGYQHQTWNPNDEIESEVHRGTLAGARVGYDGGGEHLRVRATFELYRYHREFVDEMTTWDSGGGFTLAAGYRF
jgi:hypothetical protein